MARVRVGVDPPVDHLPRDLVELEHDDGRHGAPAYEDDVSALNGARHPPTPDDETTVVVTAAAAVAPVQVWDVL